MHKLTRPFTAICLAALVAPAAVAAPNSDRTSSPARVSISVSPEAVAPGGSAEVTVQLKPSSGIKINRYPKIKVAVPAKQGVVAEAGAEVGNDSPPPLDDPESNYFEVVDPVKLTLELDQAISAGAHEIEANLTYYYCVAKSGYCAPKKTQVKIAVNVR